MKPLLTTLFLLAVSLLIPTAAWEASTSANLAINVTAGQAIMAVGLSNSTFTVGAASGTVVGGIGVTMSPSSPAFSGSLSLSGTNASSFQIIGSNLETNGAVAAGTYNINIVATEAGATGSPFTQAETVTGTTSGTSGAVPVLIQHVASSASPACCGDAPTGNSFKFLLPNPVLAGDALVLGISYPHGQALSVSDTNNGTWPAAIITEDGGAGNYVAAIYVYCGSAAEAGAADTITVVTGTNGQPFNYTISEYNNVVTGSGGTGCTDTVSSASLGAKSLTPNSGTAVITPSAFTPSTNNNANGGHIIWNYTAVSANASGNVMTWSPASKFALLDGDVAWTNYATSGASFPHASQWYIQTINGSVTPSITSTGDTGDTFNSVSVALLVAPAGGTMPSGIHINKVLHESDAGPRQTSWTWQVPTTGNLRVLEVPNTGYNPSVTDSDGSTWTSPDTADDPVYFYAANRPANPTLKVTVNYATPYPAQTSGRFYDIQGAAVSPYDTFASNQNISCGTTVTNAPTITPSTANGLVLAGMSIGTGPGLSVTSPAGAIWDLVTYTGETDASLMDNADAYAHFYNATTAQESWNWTITGASSCDAMAIAFKHG